LWYNDGMTTDNWISLVAAILVAGGTLTLAVMTWKSIRQTRSIHESEHRQRLLNEISQWAIEVSARTSPVDILKNPGWLLGTKPDEEEKFRFFQIYGWLDLMNQYSVSYLRAEYISRIASVIRNDLRKAVDDLISNIEKHIKVLKDGAEHAVKLEEYGTIIDIIFEGKSELRDELSEDAKHQLNVIDDRLELNKSATRVIELAVEIKTRDIGKKEENISKEGEATGSNEPTLKDIEEHLKQQDNEMKKSYWLPFAAFGFAVAMLGLSLAVVEDSFYYLVVAIGVVVMVVAWINARRLDKRK